MKLIVIGSSDMWGKNHSASYLLDDDILIDIPNGTCNALRNMNIDPNSIKHVLITHFHGDHYFDIPFLLLGKSIYGKNDDKIINLYLHKRGINKIAKLTRLAFPHSYKIQTELLINNICDYNFKLKEYDVKKVLVDHDKLKPAFGYVISDGKKKIGFTGDSALCKNIEYLASICDYLVCDTTRIEGNSRHMGIDNILYLKEKYPNCIYITSHMNDKTRKSLKKSNYDGIIIGEDKLEINI